jgi:hypothetical protein
MLLTARGREAREIRHGLDAEIEGRWRDRFGGAPVAGLRSALGDVVAGLDPGLPDCLPILHYGLFSRTVSGRPAPAAPVPPGDLPLWALLSRVLLAWAIEFETETERSLAISANLLRVLTPDGVRTREIPALAGISKEAVAMAMGVLTKNRLAAQGPDPAGGRWKVTRLTPAGTRAQRSYHDLAGATAAATPMAADRRRRALPPPRRASAR